MRIEIVFADPALDGRGHGVSEKLSRRLGIAVKASVIDVILPSAPVPAERARAVFTDPVVQQLFLGEPAASGPGSPGWGWLVETAFRPGVTDTLGITAREALRFSEGKDPGPVGTARQYLLEGALDAPMAARAASLLHNPLIQTAFVVSRREWEDGIRPPPAYPAVDLHDRPDCATIAVASMTDAELGRLSSERLLALSADELRAVRAWYADPVTVSLRESKGLPADATDVEIEMIAQTWSEHCKHKIFNAVIDYSGDCDTTGGDGRIDSLFKTYIRGTTEALGPSRPFLRSVFTDNSGVVVFHEGTALCVKAETHNSPSALDPYGGAITGIVGVNRDILGTGIGAKPIFNTDVLCFGYPDLAEADVPPGLMHPREVLEGVHRGIVDGGNQSGIPVVAGAFLFDESFLGKPLVFCGTGGTMPETVNGRHSWEKIVRPGALAVMLGGRIGKDGIHGATFSSLALDENSPVSAVQIGDPIIQRRMTDFLLEARDLDLYEGITDNGAGGLSSSLGEMAETAGGIRIDLDACPLKYPGLSPWEILVSESQERMSLAVAEGKLGAFMALAARRDVEATVVGAFTDSGYIEILSGGKRVGLLSLAFLHRGLPELRIRAEWNAPERGSDDVAPAGADFSADLLALLADPNVASKERLVRQYDHEVQARSVEKPFTGVGRDAPSDGGVLKAGFGDYKGITVTHGICPRYSDFDAYRMAKLAVDEAYRAHVALGGDPERAAGLDNFCWPDPVESEGTPDGAYKAAQLVRACRGLKDACMAYGIPLVSGKDSMKNDARSGGRRISVRPTLLVTIMGAIDDVRKCVSTDFLGAGEYVYALGASNGELGCTMFERVRGRAALRAGLPAPEYGECPDVDLNAAKRLYAALARAISGRMVRSCHDCSDGGIAVALAESCMGGRLGARVSLDRLPGAARSAFAGDSLAARALFCESGGRFVVSIRKEDRERFEDTLSGSPFRLIGETTSGQSLELRLGERTLASVSMGDLLAAFKTPIA